jgi:hypothetical protein
LWLVAARWKGTAASGSVSLAHGRGLRRRQILHRYRGIKDVLIALSSLQQHTTHPLAHPSTNTHTRRHKLVQPSINHVPPCELVLRRAHLLLPVHDHGRCPAILHPSEDHVRGPDSTHSTTATPNCHGTSMRTGARTSGVYYRVLSRLHVLK